MVIAILNLMVAVLLVILNGIFVAAEFSYVKVRATRMLQLISEGSFKARIAYFGVIHLDAYLSVCQLGITLASLGLGWIGEPAVARLLDPLMNSFGIVSESARHSIAVIVGFSLITFFHVVFGELAPKTLAIQKAESIVLHLGIPMKFFYYIFYPFIIVLNGTANLVIRLLKLEPASESEHSHSLEELKMLVDDSYKSGNINEGEQQMLTKVFHFESKDAKDIMIPRLDAICLHTKKTFEENLAVLKEYKHTRYPVIDDDADKIIGVLNIKDLVGRDKEDVLSLMRDVMFVPENMPLDKLLKKFQQNKQQMSVVVNEYGSYQGIISLEDVLEELVGEIQDEYDFEEPEIIEISTGVYKVSGKMPIAELENTIDLKYDFEEKDVSTVAGFILDCLGEIPSVGDRLIYDNKVFEVNEMDEQRILSVTISTNKKVEKKD